MSSPDFHHRNLASLGAKGGQGHAFPSGADILKGLAIWE
jgi:hypothetical protein